MTEQSWVITEEPCTVNRVGQADGQVYCQATGSTEARCWHQRSRAKLVSTHLGPAAGPNAPATMEEDGMLSLVAGLVLNYAQEGLK